MLYYLSRFPWRFFVHPKMGFFSVYMEVFPIGISLRVRIRGTRSDGKLNLILFHIKVSLMNIVSNPGLNYNNSIIPRFKLVFNHCN